MKAYTCLLAAGLALGLWTGAAAYPGEPEGFGDMRWGDSVKKVSERYASQYLEDTLGGGALYAVHFTDFTEQMGIRGPLVVTAAFDRGKLVQINVPLALESAEETEKAFAAYTARLEAQCGAPDEHTDDTALWVGRKTSLYVQKTEEGLLVCFMDADRMKKALSGK